MTETLPIARHYHAHAHGTPTARIELSYENRFLRRKRLTTSEGKPFLLDLEKVTSLDHGGVLILENGHEIEVIAAPEALLEVTGDNLARLAWHIGNRHTPCQVEAARLLIQRDHVLHDMLLKIGAELREVTEPFTPEGGAYGHGRTHAHAH